MRDHTQYPSGKTERSTLSTIGFQLDSIATMGRKVREQQSAKGSGDKVLFNILLKCTRKRLKAERGSLAMRQREMVCGGYHEPPWKQTKEIGTAWAKVQKIAGTPD